MQIPFLGPTYQGRSSNFEASRCINLFPELVPSQEVKSLISLVGTPGTALFATVGTTAIRGMHVFNDAIYVVSSNKLYSVSTAGVVSAALGTLASTNGRVMMSDNGITSAGVGGNQLIIVDGQAGYIYNVNTTAFSTITPSPFPANPSAVCFIDGYFIVTNNTMVAYASNLYDGLTWGALAFSPVSAASDKVQLPFNLHQQLWFIKEYTSEVWYDAGTPTTDGFPFQRVGGAVLDVGTPAPYSVARADNTLMFLATARVVESGAGPTTQSGSFIGVARLNGYNPEVISPPAINYRLAQATKLTDAVAYTYNDEGHTFYVLTLPTDKITVVYDTTTQMWHERSTYEPGVAYSIGRHVSDGYVYFNGKHYVSDYASGNIYEMATKYVTDHGLPIVSIRQAQHITDKSEFENVFIHGLTVDAETGVGTLQPNLSATVTCSLSGGAVNTYTIVNKGNDYLSVPLVTFDTAGGPGSGATATATIANGSLASIVPGSGGSGYGVAPTVLVTGPATTPNAYLSWSNDGGHTWSNEYPASMGNVGEYRVRMRWRRLGVARDRIFRLRMADPVKKVLIGAYAQVTRHG